MKSNAGRGIAMTGILFAAMAAALIGLYMTGKVNGIDEAGIAMATALRSDMWTSFFGAVTYLGSGVVLAPVGVVLIVALYAKKRRAEAHTLLLTLGGGEVLNELLKAVFARPRPTDFHLIPLPDSFSFPSGHAMIAPAFYCMLAYLVSRWLGRKAWATVIQTVTILMVILLGASRVYLGVHYFSDVLTGFCLAMCGYFLVRYGYERYLERQPVPASPILPSP